MTECGAKAFDDVGGLLAFIGDNGAAFFCDGDNLAAPVMFISDLCDKALCCHRSCDACQAWQEQTCATCQFICRHWPIFVQHTQDAPLLFCEACLGKHITDGQHDGFSGSDKSDGERARGARKMSCHISDTFTIIISLCSNDSANEFNKLLIDKAFFNMNHAASA